MHPISFTAFALLTTCALSSCAQFPGRSIQPALTASEIIALETLDPLPSGRPVQIETQFFEDGAVLASPKIVAHGGQTAAVEIFAEVSYPTRYTLAEAKAVEGDNFPVIPATPTAFKTAPTGLSLKVTPQIRGAFIELSGSVIFSWNEGDTSSSAVGEGIGPITTEDGRVTLTDNRHDLPVFGTHTTPFFIRALPGKTYTLYVKGEKGPIRIDITPRLLAPHRDEVATSPTAASDLRYVVAQR